MLRLSTVYDLASILTLDDGAFIVGGQAVTLLAEYFSARAPELAAYGPLTSKDLDYFGRIEAAEKLSQAIGGVLKLPDAGDATPNTAIVEGALNGDWVQIDFLNFVLGTSPDKLLANAIEIQLPLIGRDGHALLPVMNPLHCYQSRIANAGTLGRTTGLAETQLIASHYVLRSYIDELADKDIRSAKTVLQAFFNYLKGDPLGRRAHTFNPQDPIDILRSFSSDLRFDPLYRRFNLTAMVAQLATRRLLAP